jgi:hypothetical protein
MSSSQPCFCPKCGALICYVKRKTSQGYRLKICDRPANPAEPYDTRQLTEHTCETRAASNRNL